MPKASELPRDLKGEIKKLIGDDGWKKVVHGGVNLVIANDSGFDSLISVKTFDGDLIARNEGVEPFGLHTRIIHIDGIDHSSRQQNIGFHPGLDHVGEILSSRVTRGKSRQNERFRLRAKYEGRSNRRSNNH